MRQIETSTLSNQNIATALLAHTHTATADRMLFVRLFADQVAGNGSYVAYITIQKLGAGSAYQVQPITTAAVASGVTAIAFTTIPFPVQNTDVVKVYLIGLAGDTTTPDIITGIWENDALCPTTPGRTLDVSSTGEAGVDWANVGSPTTTVGLSGTTVATATNLTNAPTAGDLTATMKTSVTTAATAATPTAAAVTGAVGSVTGNVGGNVVGSVASVVGAVGSVAGNVAGSVGSVTGGVTVATNNDKTGYALSSAGVQAIWNALTSALTTVGSIGKLIVDNLNATISSRLASASYTAPDNASVTAIKAKTDNLPATPASTSDIPSAASNASTLLASVLESGKTVAQALLDLWSKEVGRATANDADAPTSITYRSPDDSVQITHTHTTTTRTPS